MNNANLFLVFLYQKGREMKKIKLSLVAIAAMTLVSAANANSLTEALSNGKASGDISVTYESRKQDKEGSAYYSNTAYSVGSVGINYKTAAYNNFSAEVGFRAYNTLYESDDTFTTSQGSGDATERFYESAGSSMLSRAYLAYDVENTHVKVGRQGLYTEWLTKLHDAVTVYANPVKNAELELIWSKRRGRAYARDLRPMAQTNNKEGIYKAGLTYTFNDNVKAKAYALKAPQAYDIYGVKVNLDAQLENAKLGALIHSMETSEKVGTTKDGEMIEIKVFATVSGLTATLGYVETGKENGWGSAANLGDTVVPFEEGDQMYVADAKTTYVMLNKAISGVSLTALYGVTDYKGKYDKSEFNVWAGYKLAKNTSLSIGYAMTNEDKDDTSTTDLQQLNATVTYKF